MRRATPATSGHSNDLMSTPPDWPALGGQIRAVARQLASLHAETSFEQSCRTPSERDVDRSWGGDKSE